jgi:hypothetical protein
MDVSERYLEPKPEWPSAAELAELDGEGKLVLLPDQVDDDLQGELIAGFRPDAQELRVNAQEAGLEVTLYAPPGARLGVYEEHAADWVLPVLVNFDVSLIASIVGNLISARLEAWRAERGEAAEVPVLRYRELEIEGDRTRLREIEGPANQVRDLLRERDEQPGEG